MASIKDLIKRKRRENEELTDAFIVYETEVKNSWLTALKFFVLAILILGSLFTVASYLIPESSPEIKAQAPESGIPAGTFSKFMNTLDRVGPALRRGLVMAEEGAEVLKRWLEPLTVSGPYFKKFLQRINPNGQVEAVLSRTKQVIVSSLTKLQKFMHDHLDTPDDKLASRLLLKAISPPQKEFSTVDYDSDKKSATIAEPEKKNSITPANQDIFTPAKSPYELALAKDFLNRSEPISPNADPANALNFRAPALKEMQRVVPPNKEAEKVVFSPNDYHKIK